MQVSLKRGLFCPVVCLYRGWSATNGATPSSCNILAEIVCNLYFCIPTGLVVTFLEFVLLLFFVPSILLFSTCIIVTFLLLYYCNIPPVPSKPILLATSAAIA